VQIDEQLTIRKPVLQQVGCVNDQGGLPHPGHPADGIHASGPLRTRCHAHQPSQFGLAAGERGDVTRQCPCPLHRPARRESVRRRAASCRRLERCSGWAREAQRIGQQAGRFLMSLREPAVWQTPGVVAAGR
jgi:hypothetical protein